MKRSISWAGIALIVMGGVLLLGKLGVVHIRFVTILWPLVMMFCLLGVGRGFSQSRRGRIFWSTLGFLYGLFFFLRSFEAIDIPARLFVPATFIIIGISFFMTYLGKVKDWFFLIPAGIAFGVGTLFLLADLEYLSYWEVADTLHTYWPVLLILLGLIFIFRRKPHAPPEQPAPH